MNSIVTRRRSMLHGGGTNVTYLYNEGDECTRNGGSWVFPQIQSWNGQNVDAWKNLDSYCITSTANTNYTRSKNANNIEFGLSRGQGNTYGLIGMLSCYKQNPIDFSLFSKMYIEIEGSTVSPPSAASILNISFYTVKPDQIYVDVNRFDRRRVYDFTFNKRIYEFDISTINQVLYLSINHAQYYDDMVSTNLKMYKLWLE